MSTTTTIVTAVVLPAAAPDVLQSTEQAIDLIEPGYKQGQFLFGSSKSGWLLWAVSALSEGFSIKGLDFFLEGGIEDDECRALFFKSHEIERTRAALERIFACTEARPEMVAMLIDSSYDATDVLDALGRAEPSVNPQADDGYGLDYLFAYLKSLQRLCQAASEAGGGLVHVQWN